MEYRYYQDEIDNNINKAWESVQNVLAVLPTGSGKSVVVSRIVKNTEGGVCIVAHRQELVSQMSLHLARDGIYHNIISSTSVVKAIVKLHLREYGRSFYSNTAKVAVAGVDTLIRRHDSLKQWLPTVKLWVVDESHHLCFDDKNPDPETNKDNKWGKAVRMFPNAKGLGMSVFGDTKILIKNNNVVKMVSLEDLYPQVIDAKDISKDNLYTRAWSDSKGDFVWAKISHFHRYACEKECSIITTQGNKILKVTNDHSLMKINSNSSMKAIPSNELAIGDELLLDNSMYEFTDLKINVVDICKNINKVRVYGDFNAVDINNAFAVTNFNKAKIRSLKYSWKMAKSIPLKYFDVNDMTRVKGLSTEGSYVKSPTSITVDSISWLLGYYTGNGWLDDRICLSVPFKKVYYVIDKIKQLHSIFGEFKIQVKPRQGSSEIKFSHFFLTKIFENMIGKSALTKKIPDIIFSSSNSTKIDFIEGLIDSDGHISNQTGNRSRVHYVTISDELSKGLQLLLTSIGTYSSVSTRLKSKGGIINGRQIEGKYDSYDINFSLNSFYGNNEGHKGERKHPKWLLKGKPLKIINIKPINTPDYVYDLTIDVDSHTFVANGLLAHNTATPLRLDGKGLGRHASGCMDAMIVGTEMRPLIKQKFLTDYKIYAPTTTNFDMRDIKTTSSGEFSEKEVSNAVTHSGLVVHDNATVTGDVVKSYLEFARDKPGITFVSNMIIGEIITKQYNDAGVAAELVNAKTPDQIRSNAVLRLKNGDLKQLVNVDIFGEGFDLPAIEVVSMVRPTQSYGLYVQMFGRALRPLEGKTHGIIIDHVGNVARHGLPDAKRVWTLDDADKKRSGNSEISPVKTCDMCSYTYERYLKNCPECGYYPEPAERTIEHVDGSLEELSPEFLAKLRGDVLAIDRPIDEQVNEYAANLNPHMNSRFANSAIKNFRKKVEANIESQRELRAEMAQWAGYPRADGRSDDEIFKLFFIAYGIDWLSAQSLTSIEADSLKGWIVTGKKR